MTTLTLNQELNGAEKPCFPVPHTKKAVRKEHAGTSGAGASDRKQRGLR